MNAKINITYRDKDGNIIDNPIEGQSAYSPETKKLYVYTDNEWKMITGESNLDMSMYDINKQIISQMPAMSDDDIAESKLIIMNYIREIENEFYMMLCRDMNYYTLFHIVDYLTEPSIDDEVVECIKGLGTIKSIEYVETGAIEIWFQQEDQEPVVMYFFGYDGGIIECIA